MPVARRLEDLVMWVLACELRDGVSTAVAQGSARNDWDFRGQIERSSRSIAANIAEGYGHFKPRQFAKYLRIARASAMETRNHVIEGRAKHFSPEDSARLLRLCRRIISGTASLILYLDSCDSNLDLRAQIEGGSDAVHTIPDPDPPEPSEPLNL